MANKGDGGTQIVERGDGGGGCVTDDLYAALREAAARPMTAAEIREQKVSFVYGQMGRSQITKMQVRDILNDI